MEEIKTYIESGILELYAAGALTEQERFEVESMAGKYPEIKNELTQIEIAFEQLAQLNAVEPGERVKDFFLASIEVNKEIKENIKPAVVSNSKSVNEESKIVPLKKESHFYKYAFAACLTLFLASLVAFITVLNRYEDAKNQIAQLVQSNQNFANRTNYLDTKLTESKEYVSMLTQPNTKTVALAGTKLSPTAKLLVRWNPDLKKVSIDVSSMSLPINDEQHQYQLWALVDGKPVDLGVFDVKTNVENLVIEMKSIGIADAFAVTLEPKGGSRNPTMNQMFVMGAAI